MFLKRRIRLDINAKKEVAIFQMMEKFKMILLYASVQWDGAISHCMYVN